MAITMPNLEITFKQLAASLIARSERGIAILITKDVTVDCPTYAEYKSFVEVDSDKYTATNLQYIKDIFTFALNKVVVVNYTGTATLSDALSIVEKNIKTGWITLADGLEADFATLVTWIKAKETAKQTYKAVVYNIATAPDCKHIVNFYNSKVTFTDARGEVTGDKYCPSLIGILASCNIKRGTTYFKCSNLTKVIQVADNNTAVASGQFILINDVDTVKVGLGINSLTTTDGITATEDMKFIDIVEAMDLVNDDISNVFKNEYLGAYRNKYDNQILLISAINSYFTGLEDENILDDEYSNKADIDVDAQRATWVGSGKTEASEWTDAQVKANAYKRTVFLAANIKILGAMENLKFNIAMF